VPKFRLMATSGTSEALIYNLEYRLNTIQSAFMFDVYPKPIAVPYNKEGPVPSSKLENLALKIARDRYHGEVPVLITDREIDDGFSSYDNTVAVISTYHWGIKDFSPWPSERYLLYTIADVLMNFEVNTPVHNDKRGCIGDYCNDERDINFCLESCDYCPECKRLISSALTKSEISPRNLAAIHRILDSAADRRRAFVVMPFQSDFDVLYECLKRVLEELGWQCLRADTDLHSSDILKIIHEEIERCQLVIADLTGPNANVTYEVGYADAVGKNVILLTQKIGDVPFDVGRRLILEYSPTASGYEKMAGRLRAKFTVG
jgi:hypothetical protein